MKESFLNNYINIIIKDNPTLNNEQIEKIKYGIEGIYLTITKLVIIIILGISLGIVKETLMLLFSYNILRFFGFGYHAKTSKQCLLLSIIFFIIFPLLVIKRILILKYIELLIALCFINFLLFAPSDTKKRPMINKRKKLIRKTLLLIVVSVYYLLTFITNYEITSILLIALIIETVMVNPLIYKLTGQPYNNYKDYLRKH